MSEVNLYSEIEGYLGDGNEAGDDDDRRVRGHVHLPEPAALAPSVPPEMCSGSEEGSYSRLIDFCITQL